MLSKEMTVSLNEQINKEMDSAYLYMSITHRRNFLARSPKLNADTMRSLTVYWMKLLISECRHELGGMFCE